MARPFKLYEKIKAEMDTGKRAIADGPGKRRRAIKAQTAGPGPHYVRRDIGAVESQEDVYSFPNELMSKRELVKRTGVPRKVVAELIRRGHLKAIRFPGYRWRKYSGKQLERLVKNFNRLS